MNDAYLIGYTLQLIAGAKMVEQGLVEIKIMEGGEKKEVKIEDAVKEVAAVLEKLKQHD